jgi:hypothetical protein
LRPHERRLPADVSTEALAKVEALAKAGRASIPASDDAERRVPMLTRRIRIRIEARREGRLRIDRISMTAELVRATRENARLVRRLERAEAIIEIQKTVAARLGRYVERIRL